jgi:hypothetical protein
MFCERGQGRAPRLERAVRVLLLFKGRNLQLQCAVSTEDGLVLYRLQRGSIQMDVNADFAKSIYRTVKDLYTFQRYYEGKNVVIVLDNAPGHHQTEARLQTVVDENNDLILLHLGPYSPMCNPIEGRYRAHDVWRGVN